MKHASAGGPRVHFQDTGAGIPLVVLNGWACSGLTSLMREMVA
jgi:hypothetical protein